MIPYFISHLAAYNELSLSLDTKREKRRDAWSFWGFPSLSVIRKMLIRDKTFAWLRKSPKGTSIKPMSIVVDDSENRSYTLPSSSEAVLLI